MTNLFSVIRIQDDLTSASSYFFREVAEIKNIIDSTAKNEHAIILLDELFKGTNTIERIASAKAVLSFLAKKNCQIFASTHDLELTTLLKDEFELAFFSENIVENNIQFDYKLKLGVPKNGNAIKILELNGFPTEIVEEAVELSFSI
jgi:DNA mismatch repair ATPase MutS